MRDQSKAINQKEAVPIGRHAEPAFSAAIVGRDSMGSDLLVNALVHNLRYDAIAIQSSNLLQVLGARSVDLVIISANLDANIGGGFDLANAVFCAHPKLSIVILMDRPTREAVTNAFRSGARGDGRPHRDLRRRADLLHSGARRLARKALRPLEVSHDEPRRRGERPAARGGRARVPRDLAREYPPPVPSRRTAAALERPEGRHVLRGTASRRPRGSGAV